MQALGSLYPHVSVSLFTLHKRGGRERALLRAIHAYVYRRSERYSRSRYAMFALYFLIIKVNAGQFY